MDELSTIGIWSMGGNSPEDDQAVAGKLEYAPEDGISLELYGAFTEKLQNNEYSSSVAKCDVIYGVTTSGDFVTLLDCTAVQFSEPSPGLPTIKYYCAVAFVGSYWLDTKRSEHWTFDNANFSFNYFYDWMQLTSLFEDHEFERNERGEVRLSVTKATIKLPLPLEFSLVDVLFRASNIVHHEKTRQGVLSYSDRSVISLVSEVPKELSDWVSNYIGRLQDFFSLSLGQAVGITELSLRPIETCVQDDPDQRKRFGFGSFLRVYFQPVYYQAISDKSLHPQDKIFLRTDIDDLQSTLNKWFQFQDEPYGSLVCQLLLNTWYRPETFLETKFLNLAQAAEVFHKAYYNKNPLSREEFNRRKAMIAERLRDEPEVLEWYNKTQGTNYQYLLERLLYLYDLSKSTLQKLFPQADTFCKQIRDTRNYYTHYEKANKADAASGVDLYLLNQSILYMLMHLVLMRVGFSDEKISELIEANPTFEHVRTELNRRRQNSQNAAQY